MQARFVIAFGFVFLGAAFLYSRNLVPDIEHFRTTLVKMRVFQTMRARPSCSCRSRRSPISTLPRQLTRRAPRRCSRCSATSPGSGQHLALVGAADHRAQVRGSGVYGHGQATMTPYSQPYLDALAAPRSAPSRRPASAATTAQQSALGQIYQQLIDQSQLLALHGRVLDLRPPGVCAAPLAPAALAGEAVQRRRDRLVMDGSEVE